MSRHIILAEANFLSNAVNIVQISVFTQNGQTEPPPRKLLDRVRDAIRVKHNSYQTEKSYVQWVRRFISFHNKQHPSEMGAMKLMLF